MKQTDRFAMLGLVLIAPSIVVMVCGVAGLDFPRSFGHPLIVLGGLVSALALNLFAILHLGTERTPDGALSAFTVRLKITPTNWAIALLSLALTTGIAAYLFVEYFQPR